MVIKRGNVVLNVKDYIINMLNKCERMAKHTFTTEALDVLNSPFDKQFVSNHRNEVIAYIKSAHKAMKVDHPSWQYDIYGNTNAVFNSMKKWSLKMVKSNKFTIAINELYFLELLNSSPVNHYKYLVFAYGKVPFIQKYKFHFINKNNGYRFCIKPLNIFDILKLIKRIKVNLAKYW